MPDGSLPIHNGKLSWVGNVDQAMKDAESWGATHLVVLHQRDDSEKWFITDEIPRENAKSEGSPPSRIENKQERNGDSLH